MTQKTPVINNDLNPIWQERNQFSFNIAHHEADRYLFLEAVGKRGWSNPCYV
ncbi:unnamed protein product [Effrenium voratum]|uniref:C2 domain-containing protein n=1 Tax=Effrenium voratum TaxID=2562239 RepID=A0AA36NJI9_9DINO|nr:unnamed protein product [Effrenium voratum]